MVKVPPKSLDQYYPPVAPGPLYLGAMYGLEGPFSGMTTSLGDKDMKKAQQYFEAFQKEYAKVAAMVPEWSQQYPSAPVDKLGEALKSGNVEGIQAGVKGVGEVCATCHDQSMPAVFYRYHYKDFDQVIVTDTVSGGSMPFPDYMWTLAGSMGGMNTYVAEGRFDAAQKALGQLQARMEGLKKGCESCHDKAERRYFVSSDIFDVLASTANELSQKQPDPAKVGGLVQKFGTESCRNCHVVHNPAAFVRSAWAAK
jgi:cytochrome c556